MDRIKVGFHRFVKPFTAMALVLAVLLMGAASIEKPAVAATEDGMIRVNLSSFGNLKTIKFTTTCNYAVGGKASDQIPSGTAVTVSISGGKLQLKYGGKTRSMGANFVLKRGKPGVFGVKFTSPSKANLYAGDLLFSATGGSIRTVLRIYIEDYLYGVVAYEMSDSFPIEALKAQAIVARTYALMSRSSSAAYDVVDTAASQVFRGYNGSYKNVLRAVNETQGLCVYYNGQYARCYYSASNGGQTELTKNIWGGTTVYMPMKDDPYDVENPSSVVKSHTIPKKPTHENPLNSALRSALISGMKSTLQKGNLKTDATTVSIDEILEIKPVTPKYSAPSKAFTALNFKMKVSSADKSSGNRKDLSEPIDVEIKTYGLLKGKLGLGINKTDNEIISVDAMSDAFQLNFRRYGHGVGMSQRGAQWMAKKYGKSHREILMFYYDNIQITKRDYIDDTGNYSSAPQGGTEKPDSEEEYVELKRGSTGDKVKALQRRLKDLYYFAGDIGGNYLDLTESAVKDFQRVQGLKANGVATVETQKVLYSYSAKAKPTSMPVENKATESPTQTPTPEPTATPTVKPTKTAAVYATVSNPSGITMRKSASTKAKSVLKLKKKAKVQVLSVKNEWAKLKSGKKTGYAPGYYLTYVKSGEPVSPSPNLVAGKKAYVNMKNTSSKLTVYQKASKSSKALSKLKHQTVVTVVTSKKNSDFVKIRLKGKEGFVEKKYLTAIKG